MIKIAVIEDDQPIREMYLMKLKHAGYDAKGSEDGEKGLVLVKECKPDLILLDINLPATNGYEVLKQIRADEKLKSVTVIAVTAQDADTEIPKCKEAGFDGFIGKPLSRSRFPRQLRRILNGEAVWETY